MQNIKPVPDKITTTLSNLLPNTIDYGHKIAQIKISERQFYPSDFIAPLYWQYYNYEIKNASNHISKSIHSMALPKMYLLIYRIVMNIPSIPQLSAVVRNDVDFANACCFSHPEKPFVGIYGLDKMQQTLLKLETGNKPFQEALHNISDILDYGNITFKGLIPSVWVQSFNQQIPKLEWYDAIFNSNTGINVIDELTLHLPQEYRPDARQESALNCLRIGIDNLTKDEIVLITKMVIKKYRNQYSEAKYKNRSLFSKPFSDSDTELWETIASPDMDAPCLINECNKEEQLINDITQSKQQVTTKLLDFGDINCNHKIAIEFDDNGNKIGVCVHCGRKALLEDTIKVGA